MASVFPLCLVAGVALTPGPSPYGRGGNFGFDVGCGWLGMGCGMDFRSFGFAQDDSGGCPHPRPLSDRARGELRF